MNKYRKEILIIIAQLFMFYVFPLMAEPIGAIGMVLSILAATFILALIMGTAGKGKIRYLYPVLTAILFIPSVFIYYNESALIHSIWYLAVSFVGVCIGALISRFCDRK